MKAIADIDFMPTVIGDYNPYDLRLQVSFFDDEGNFLHIWEKVVSDFFDFNLSLFETITYNSEEYQVKLYLNETSKTVNFSLSRIPCEVVFQKNFLTFLSSKIGSFAGDGSSAGGGSVDLTPVNNVLQEINSKLTSLVPLSVFDLNGSLGSYPNDTAVTIEGVKGDYKIESSTLTWNTPNSGELMLVYNCSNNEGYKITSPHCYVKPKVA